MKIRPLHKTPEGHWRSDCGEWLFVKRTRKNNTATIESEGWYLYQKMIDNKFHKDTPFFYYPHNTREETIKNLESIKYLKGKDNA